MYGNSPDCIEGPWGKCSTECKQIREISTHDASSADEGKMKCGRNVETRDCYSQECPLRSSDTMAQLHLRIRRLPLAMWSYKMMEELEDVIRAMAQKQNVSVALETISKELIGANNGEGSEFVSLILSVRAAWGEMDSVMQWYNQDGFKQTLCSDIQRRHSRTGWNWLHPEDINIMYPPHNVSDNLLLKSKREHVFPPFAKGKENTQSSLQSSLFHNNYPLMFLFMIMAMITASVLFQVIRKRIRSNVLSSGSQVNRYRRFRNQ